MGGYTKEQLLARLKELQINFSSYEHPAVLTVEAQAKYVGHLGGALSKNLFLKDKKHRFYVISALAGVTVDLKVLSQRLGLGKGGLRMAPEEALQEILQVPLGTVTPFALINESASAVSLLLDKGFKAQECCFFHPLSNEVSISLNTQDLDKFLISIGRNPTYVDLEASPLVGKDQPPDLAALVPSESPSLVGAPEKAVQSPASADNHAPTMNKSTKNTAEGSASCTSSNSPSTDLIWAHCTAVDVAPRKVQCKYCNWVIYGGIWHFKQHLAGIKCDIAVCNIVSFEVRVQFHQYIKEKEASRL